MNFSKSVLDHPLVKRIRPFIVNRIVKRGNAVLKNRGDDIKRGLDESQELFFTEEPENRESGEWILWDIITNHRDSLIRVLESQNMKEMDLEKWIEKMADWLKLTQEDEGKTGVLKKIGTLDSAIARAGLRLVLFNRDRYLSIFEYINEDITTKKKEKSTRKKSKRPFTEKQFASQMNKLIPGLLDLSKNWDQKITGTLILEDEKDGRVLKEATAFVRFMIGKMKLDKED